MEYAEAEQWAGDCGIPNRQEEQRRLSYQDRDDDSRYPSIVHRGQRGKPPLRLGCTWIGEGEDHGEVGH
jgi:hypothetical protein